MGNGPDAYTPSAVSTTPPAVSTGAPSALAAFTDPPSAGEMAALRTAVNTINTRLTEVLARVDGVNTRLTEVLTRLNGAITALQDLHALETERAGLDLETTVGT